MNDTFTIYTWHENLYLRWTVLPVLAHLFSWMTGIGGLLLFPILLTVAQYLILRRYPATCRAGAWFFTLPLTFFIWIKWGPFNAVNQGGDAIFRGVIAYYVGQFLNTAFIPLVIKKQRPKLLVSWLLSQAVAFTIWVVLYKLLVTTWPNFLDKREFSSSSIWVIWPSIALIANAVSGLIFINKRLLPGYENE